jgi:hypothetical protein
MVRAGLVLLGLIHVVNGLWMLAAPDSWYVAIPGVAMTGPINHHFIADVGLAFVASGAGLLLGARNAPHAGALAMAGATWPALHAVLHIWGWVRMGLPSNAQELISTGVGVIVVGALGVALAWFRVKDLGDV